MLEWAMDNVVTQWVDDTRFMGEDELSGLYLISTKESGIIDEIKYKSPIGKSGHALIVNCKGKEEEKGTSNTRGNGFTIIQQM